jgi:hypothetical protein
MDSRGEGAMSAMRATKTTRTMKAARATQDQVTALKQWRKDQILESGNDPNKLREIERVFKVLELAVTRGYDAARAEFDRQVRPMKSFKVMD